MRLALTSWALVVLLAHGASAQTTRFRDPDWAREWIDLYDAGEPGLLRLDTSRIDLSPAAMFRRPTGATA